ncbi:MAG: DUF308 domain-containing protein [Roseiarcus sp.]|jgi:uncharacterized membrane protein HdeD (DUF308 family)
MASSISGLGEMHRGIKQALSAHWRMLMFQGGALIVLGILAIGMPLVATIAVDIFIGWLFLIGGIAGFIAIFSADDIPAFLWSLVTAALSVALGVFLIWKPIEGVYSLTLALTGFFIAEGVFQIVASIAYRRVIENAWGFMLASGVCDLILVAVIIYSWPISAAWTLGLLAGFSLLTSGAAIVMTAFAARDMANTLGGSVGAR